MARFTWVLIGLTAACASVEKAESTARPSCARIAALEDARTDGDGELQRLAGDSDAIVRARAVTALGRLWFPEHGAEITRVLLQALGDADAQVRGAAAFALGLRGDPSAADTLVFVALDFHRRDGDALVRARATEAASKLDRPELHERLLEALDDAQACVRREAALGAARWPSNALNAAKVNQRLVDALALENDASTVTALLFALERRKAVQAASSFVRYSSAPDAEQRLFAVRGLKLLAKDPRMLGHLWRASTDGDVRIATEAVLGLGACDDAGSMLYIARASKHSSAHVRRAAWESAAAAGARDQANARHLSAAGMPLSGTIGSSAPPSEPSSWVRGAMVEAELRLAAPRPGAASMIDSTLELLDTAYRKLSREERIGAVRGIAALDEERAVPRLLECIRDPELAVGETALEMLGKFPTPRVREALRQVTGFGDNGLRLAAVLALQELPDEGDLPALERCYDSSSGDGSSEIRFNVLRSAGKIGGDAALGLLMKGLLDPSAFVRRVAREELAAIDAQAAQQALALALGAERALEPLELPDYAASPLVDVLTTKGKLRFELLPDEAPVHVASFLELAARDHYDGTLWHRVVSDFVVQGGDYRGDGNGGGTWKGQDRSLRHEIGPRKYVRGSLGMPRNEDVDSGGSQIFVTHRATPHLDGRYTIFGELREGFEVLDALEVGDRILDVIRAR
ncbi:MAG: peptidylprolyl isomerase [Planctomycetes bacterium]|nr:peptidylprolyl isomerase [Planctomycetota bacterium]